MTTWRALVLGLALTGAAPAFAKGGRSDRVAKKAKRHKAPPPPAETSDEDTGDGDAVVDDDTRGDRPDKKSSKGEQDRDDRDDKPMVGGDVAGPDEADSREGRGESERREPRDEAAPATAADKSAAQPLVKQNLTGHDFGSAKKVNEFERDRFFVDKIDTPSTEKGTLIQGSLTSSSLAFVETGGKYAPATATNTSAGNNGAAYSRFFTDLRLQTDFRHIAGSRWEARVDARVRVVNSPTAPDMEGPNGHIQSGLTGQNEYEVRELWLVRNGVRTDFVLGRQFIPDLGAVKIDGLRFDYASSKQLTVLGFAGLYPLRGSRSITTDYIELKDPADPTRSAGKYVGAAGFTRPIARPLRTARSAGSRWCRSKRSSREYSRPRMGTTGPV